MFYYIIARGTRTGLPRETQNYLRKADITINNNTGGSAVVASSQLGALGGP